MFSLTHKSHNYLLFGDNIRSFWALSDAEHLGSSQQQKDAPSQLSQGGSWRVQPELFLLLPLHRQERSSRPPGGGEQGQVHGTASIPTISKSTGVSRDSGAQDVWWVCADAIESLGHLLDTPDVWFVLDTGAPCSKQTRNMPARKQTGKAAEEILLQKHSVLFPSLLLTYTEQPQKTTLLPQDSSCPLPLLILSS